VRAGRRENRGFIATKGAAHKGAGTARQPTS